MAQDILTTLHKLNHGIAILVGIMLLICAAVNLLDIVQAGAQRRI